MLPFRLFSNRGYPANMDVLSKLIELRHRAATLCGFSTFADMEADIRMIGSEAKHREFLDEVDRASRGAAASEAAVLLEAKRHDRPDATALDWSDEKYYILGSGMIGTASMSARFVNTSLITG